MLEDTDRGRHRQRQTQTEADTVARTPSSFQVCLYLRDDSTSLLRGEHATPRRSREGTGGENRASLRLAHREIQSRLAFFFSFQKVVMHTRHAQSVSFLFRHHTHRIQRKNPPYKPKAAASTASAELFQGAELVLGLAQVRIHLVQAALDAPELLWRL
jgi:hypothetical protein